MAYHKPLTEVELRFIQTTYRTLGPSECARRMGRSKSVVKARAKSMGLTTGGPEKEPDAGAQTAPRPTNDEAASWTTAQRLEEARDVLRSKMLEADPRTIAAIVREYRSILHDLDATAAPRTGDDLKAAIARALEDA